jgi:hypothetical protein
MQNKMNLWKMRAGIAAIVLILFVCPSSAVIFTGTKFTLDFTKPAELNKKASWGTESKNVSFSEEGLTLKAQENASADVWIQVTEPIALGLSWRTVWSVNIEAEVAGQNTGGTLYSRYSADALHWSDWQNIKINQPQDPNNAQQQYSGTLAVPARQRQKYVELLMKYQKMDVPWKIDEEAAVEWIVKNDPNYFKNPSPFIGYLQFLFEISLKAGQYIKTINFDIQYSVGGLFTLPKGKKLESINWDTPWRYKAPSVSQEKNAQIMSIQAAIDAFYLNCGVYPKSLDDLLSCPAGLEGKWAGPYLKQSQLIEPWTSNEKVMEKAKYRVDANDLELAENLDIFLNYDKELNKKWDLPQDVAGETPSDKLFLHYATSPMVALLMITDAENGVVRLLRSSITLHEFYRRSDLAEGAMKMYREYDFSPQSISDESILERFSRKSPVPNDIVNYKIARICMCIYYADMTLLTQKFFTQLKGHEREFLKVMLDRYEIISRMEQLYGTPGEGRFGAAMSGVPTFCLRFAENLDKELYNKLQAINFASQEVQKQFIEEIKQYLEK